MSGKRAGQKQFLFLLLLLLFFFKIKSVVLKGESSVDFEVLKIYFTQNLHLPLSEGQGGRWSFPKTGLYLEATPPSMYVLKHPKKASG